MPRKIAQKPTSTDLAPDAEAAPQPSAMPLSAVPKVAKKASAKSSKPAAKKAAGTTRKRKPAVTGSASTSAAKNGTRRTPSDEEIRIRAYFIAERRMQHGIPGSEAEDWLEARRQLESESAGA